MVMGLKIVAELVALALAAWAAGATANAATTAETRVWVSLLTV
jgi:hypothetical protein